MDFLMHPILGKIGFHFRIAFIFLKQGEHCKQRVVGMLQLPVLLAYAMR